MARKKLMIDEHVPNTRGSSTMEMGIKKTTFLSSQPSTPLSNSYLRYLSYTRRPSFLQKQHRPCHLVYQLVVSEFFFRPTTLFNFRSQDGGTFFFST
jgi:hypothetical protein